MANHDQAAKKALNHIRLGDKLWHEAEKIRSQVVKADKLEAQAEQHYKAAARIFAKIKAAHDTRTEGPWKTACQRKCGFSRRRVDELLQLIEGTVTLSQQRTRAREGMRRKRGVTRNSYAHSWEETHAGTDTSQAGRVKYRCRLGNLVAGVDEVADEFLSVHPKAWFEVKALAIMARRVAEKWNKIATNLERLADNERQETVSEKPAA